MAEVLLFHHALGLTDGCIAFADDLRAAGHVVHTPDLYDGRSFTDLAGGVAHAEEIGFETVIERGRSAAESLPAGVVYAGLSLGVLPAQMLAQTRAGAQGALLLYGCVPTSEFACPWPEDVPLQINMMESDPWVVDGDLPVARDLAATTDAAELYVYPGEGHLFADSGAPGYDSGAATLLRQRVLAFLDEAGRRA